MFDILWLDGHGVTGCRSTSAAPCCEVAAALAARARDLRSTMRSPGSAPAARDGKASSPSGATRPTSTAARPLAQDEVRGDAGVRRRRLHRSAGQARRARRAARRLLRRATISCFAGKVGTGFDTKLLLDLRARLDALEIPKRPFTKARACRGCARTGCGRRSSSRSRSSNGPCTASSVIRGCSALPDAGKTPARASCGADRDHASRRRCCFPTDGITKGELAAYYEAIAPIMLPHIRARPITMERYPAGIGKKGFIQKDVSKGFPAWLERVEVPKKDGTVHHPIVTDTRSLLWIANQNSITPHVWTSRAPGLYHPDICVFDLDPSRTIAAPCAPRRLALRDLLDELGLPSWVKTSGSKGFHIVVPLDGKAHMGEVARFAHAVGALLVKRRRST